MNEADDVVTDAWTSQSNIHWIAPCIGMGFLYSGLLLIYLSIFTYLADAYVLYASSALSVRLPLFFFPLFEWRLMIMGRRRNLS